MISHEILSFQNVKLDRYESHFFLPRDLKLIFSIDINNWQTKLVPNFSTLK